MSLKTQRTLAAIGIFVIVLCLLALVVAVLMPAAIDAWMTVFEDGSWVLGPLNGCLEGAICQL